MNDASQLTAADVMQAAVVTAHSDDRLADLKRTLFEEQIGGMPVVDDGRLVGVVSRSDYVRVPLLLADWQAYALAERTRDETASGETNPAEAWQDDPRFQQLRVRQIMPTQVVTCDRTTLVAEVAGRMLRHHVHRVIVVEEDRPVGIVSSLDLVRLLATDNSV